MGTGQGFWSYVHKDNDGMRGAILQVARDVQDEYGVITGGAELDLFLDNMKLKWGDKWRSQIRDAIAHSTFFIPIITPRYFKSEECRNELLGFAEQAQELGREALIMPLYFVDVPELERGNSDDPMIKLVAESQMRDWRTRRFLDQTTQPYRLAVNDLATQLVGLPSERETGTSPKSSPSVADEEEGQAPEDRSYVEAPDANKGVLELLAEGEDALPRLVETLQSISSEIEKVGDLANAATEEMGESDAKGEGFKGRLIIVHRLSKQLDLKADQLERLTSEYVADLVLVDPAIRQMIKLASDQADDEPDETEEFFSSILGMITGSEEGAAGITELIDSFDGAGSFSHELDAPLNRLRSSLQSLIDSNGRMDAWRGAIEAARK
jgi:hypothetical protein